MGWSVRWEPEDGVVCSVGTRRWGGLFGGNQKMGWSGGNPDEVVCLVGTRRWGGLFGGNQKMGWSVWWEPEDGVVCLV